MAGRPNWLVIWVVYQVTCPSFWAAAIKAASAASGGRGEQSMPQSTPSNRTQRAGDAPSPLGLRTRL